MDKSIVRGATKRGKDHPRKKSRGGKGPVLLFHNNSLQRELMGPEDLHEFL
jgi:hypothetical protein